MFTTASRPTSGRADRCTDFGDPWEFFRNPGSTVVHVTHPTETRRVADLVLTVSLCGEQYGTAAATVTRFPDLDLCPGCAMKVPLSRRVRLFEHEEP